MLYASFNASIPYVAVYNDYFCLKVFEDEYMIKNILLDLDDTLLDFHKAEHIALSKSLNKMGIEPLPSVLDRYSEINLWHWRQLELGKLTRKEVLTGRYRKLFEEFKIDASAEAAQALYEHNLSIGHYFMPGAEELLEELKGNYRLFLASNGTATVQHSRIKSANIAHYFDDIFISQEIGADKPSHEFFSRAFSRVPDMEKSDTVIIGDSLTSDIRGGENFGIETIWFNPKRKENHTLTTENPVHPSYEIDSLSKIRGILENMQQ